MKSDKMESKQTMIQVEKIVEATILMEQAEKLLFSIKRSMPRQKRAWIESIVMDLRNGIRLLDKEGKERIEERLRQWTAAAEKEKV